MNLGFVGTVLAGLVVAGILGAFGQIPIVSAWAVDTWRRLVHPVSVPLVVLIVMTGALIVFVAGLVLKSIEPALPAWLEYREDNFLGIVWRWRYEGSHLAESSLRPFCPQCGTGMRGEQHGYKDMTTSFMCDECQFTRDIPGNGAAIIDRISRLIEREANRRLAQPTGSPR